MKSIDIKAIISEIKYRYNCSQKDIAETIGVKATYLSDVASGRLPFTDNLKANLSEHYSDVTIFIVEDEDSKSEKTLQKSKNNSGVNMQAGGDIKNSPVNETMTIDKLITEIAEQRKDYMSQINRLLTIIETK